jgi:parallel beta-helix repeat protein
VRNEINANVGVHLSAAEGNQVARNRITQSGTAITVRGGSTGNRISSNRIASPNSIGIALEVSSGNRLEYNRISNARSLGILLEQASGNHLAHNRISGSGGAGIELFIASENRLEHNRVSGSRLDGIHLLPDLDPTTDTSDNELVGNVSEENGGFGFYDRRSVGSGTAGTANLYDGNRCRGNEEGPSLPAGLCRSPAAIADGARARR